MNAERLKDYNFLKSKTIDEIYSLFDGLSDAEKRSVINNKNFLEKLSENEVYDLLNGLSEDDYFIILHNPYFLRKVSQISLFEIIPLFSNKQLLDLFSNSYFLEKLSKIEDPKQVLDLFDENERMNLLRNSKFVQKINLDGEKTAEYLKYNFSKVEKFELLNYKFIADGISSQYLSYLARDLTLEERTILLSNPDFTANLNVFSIMEIGKDVLVTEKLDGKSIATLAYNLPHDKRYEIIYDEKFFQKLDGDGITRLIYDFSFDEKISIINDKKFFDKLSGQNICHICEKMSESERIKVISNRDVLNKLGGSEITSLISDFDVSLKKKFVFNDKIAWKLNSYNIELLSLDFSFEDKIRVINLFLDKLQGSTIFELAKDGPQALRHKLLSDSRIFEKLDGYQISCLVSDFGVDERFDFLNKDEMIKKYKDIDLRSFTMGFSDDKLGKVILNNDLIRNIKTDDLIFILNLVSDSQKLRALDDDFILENLSMRDVCLICEDMDINKRGELLEKNKIQSKIKSLDGMDDLNGRWKRYFDLFGGKALDLIRKKPKEIKRVIDTDKIDLLKGWFDKTGQKFIPPFYVVSAFPLKEASKFLTSQRMWNRCLKYFPLSSDSDKIAFMKFAYAFGVFDGDADGFTKLTNILKRVPRYINKMEYEKLSSDKLFDSKLKEISVSEGLKGAQGFSDVFRENNGRFTLTLDVQKYPKTMMVLRKKLENLKNRDVLSFNDIVSLANNFDFIYDKSFYEFFLKNLDDIFNNQDSMIYISEIQRRFAEIKTVNSNRKLDLNLAINYVRENKYGCVMRGNEELAELSKIAGYNDEDFMVLQNIYNEGRKRVFSTIPRVTGNIKGYRYEIIRLDNPLSLTIGVMSDCCQKLHDAAETCMEHSAVSKDGRLFVLYDESGNLVAQSWVWRNRDVLCFDNIEIPKRAFKRFDSTSERTKFTNNVFDAYMKCAKELFIKDEKVYKSLLEEGKITREDFNGLRLGKITIGLGYNDIASVIQKKLNRDEDILVRPASFVPPVPLNRDLYVMDSEIQYVALKRDDRIYSDKEALDIYYDEVNSYKLKDALDILKRVLNLKFDSLVLKKLEEAGMDLNLVKVAVSPNLIIVYEEDTDKVRVWKVFINDNIFDDDYKRSVLRQLENNLKEIASSRRIEIIEGAITQDGWNEKWGRGYGR